VTSAAYRLSTSWLAAPLAVLLALGQGALAEEKQPAGVSGDRPNIIVILADDLGYSDLGAQGVRRDVRTPNLDRMAAEGVRCSAGYATAPQCTPSRAGLLTGRYQQRFGLESNPEGPLAREEVTIAERLQAAGYTCGMVGKWHLDPNAKSASWAAKHLTSGGKRSKRVEVPQKLRLQYSPHAQGFQEFFDGTRQGYWANFDLAGQPLAPGGQSVRDGRFRIDVQSDAAVKFIERSAEQPFFLYLAYFAPHVPLEATAEYLARFPEPMANRRRHALAMISAMDDGVGRILQTLKERQLDENTLIVFASDNGAPLKLDKEDVPVEDPGGAWDGSLNEPWVGEKGMLSEGGIRVPFVWRFPGKLPAGKVYPHAISTLDIAATAVALAGLEKDTALDGVNVLAHLSGCNSEPPHEALYWRFQNQAAIRRGNWKYLQLANGRQFLFDLSSDAHEHANLLSEQPDVARELREKLAGWAAELQPPGLPSRQLNPQERNWYDFYFPQAGTPQ